MSPGTKHKKNIKTHHCKTNTSIVPHKEFKIRETTSL